jgi:hypothetical protein
VIRWIVLAVVVIGAAIVATQWSMADVAEPDYTVVRDDDPYEVRRYEPMIVASVEVTGSRWGAASDGFGKLADYIFGANVPAEAAGRGTALVEKPGRDGTKIDMTAPVLQKPRGERRWTVSFVMPESFTMDSLPRPKSDAITLEKRPAETVAVLKFSGLPTGRRLDARTAALRMWMDRHGLEPANGTRYAFYDPPWTLPFLRRNEIIVPVTGLPRQPVAGG